MNPPRRLELELPAKYAENLGARAARITMTVVWVCLFIGMVATSLIFGRFEIGILIGIAFAYLASYGYSRVVRHLRWIAFSRVWLSQQPGSREIFVRLAEELGSLSLNPSMAEATVAMARRGMPGACVRFRPQGKPEPTFQTPIDVPFEPCPLDERDSGFRGVAIRTADLEEREPSGWWRTLVRTHRLGRTFILAIAAVYLMSAFIDLIRGGTVHLLPILVGLSFIVSSALILTERSRLPLLVPGGLVCRRPKWFRPAFDYHLFRPEASILVLLPNDKRHWFWVVADQEASDSGDATTLEVETLLRAWFSRVEPPPDHLLGALTQSADS
ncbi:MAG: hypothetical protein AMXMBFR47_03370 [Planctomycetota bacterium]